MRLSTIANSIKASPTLALNAKAAAMLKNNIPVINLGGGEPQSSAPIEATTEAIDLLKTRIVRYTPTGGIPELKEAVINYTKEHYNHIVDNKNVIVSSGAKQALMVALQSIINPGDKVLFPSPYWVSYPDMVKMCSGIPIPIIPSNGSLHPNIEDIKNQIDENVKAIIVNSPNNPSGVVYSKEFIAAIVNFCEHNDIYLIMDEIYHRMIFDDKKKINPLIFSNNFPNSSKIILINGVSKAYAMTGFRIGWAIANEEIISAMTNLQGHQTSCTSIVLQKAAMGALNGAQNSVEELCLTLKKNRDLLIDQLKSIDNVKVYPSDGTFYTFVDFSYYEKSSTKLSNYLIDKVQLLTVPGIEFGRDGFLRISFCGSSKEIIEGAERLKSAIYALSKNKVNVDEDLTQLV